DGRRRRVRSVQGLTATLSIVMPAHGASKTRVNALVALGHPRRLTLCGSRTWTAGTSRTRPAMRRPSERGRSPFQDRLTVGCDVLTVAMQVRVLLLDPILSKF